MHCNPVVVSYLLIERDESDTISSSRKRSQPNWPHTSTQTASPCTRYEEIGDYLSNSFNADSILVNPAKTNYAIYSAIRPGCRIINGASPVALLKAIRNKQEIAGIHAAMQRDGVALVKFLKWLDEAVPAGKETEISVDKKLHTFRAAQPLYMGESFDTIAGYKEHGAIVHYEATPETDVSAETGRFSAAGLRGAIPGRHNGHNPHHRAGPPDGRGKDSTTP